MRQRFLIVGVLAVVLAPALRAQNVVPFAGPVTFTSAPTFSTMSLGSVFFAGAGGVLTENNANFFWDASKVGLTVGPRTGFAAKATADLAATRSTYSWLNPSGAQGTGLMVISQDNGTVFSDAAIAIFVSTHAAGTRLDEEAFEGDAFHHGAGDATNLTGVGGYAETNAGTVTTAAGLLSYGFVSSGGATTTGAGLILNGNQLSAGTVANSYGLLIRAQPLIGGTETFSIKTLGGPHELGGVVNVKTNSADAAPAQLVIKGSTDANQQLLIGYNTTSNYAGIQSILQLTGVQPLVLQPLTGSVGIADTTPTEGILTVDGDVNAALYETRTNCADSTGDAACAAAPSGHFVIDAADSNTVISTTAVTANSEIFLQEDSSLGALLTVTCNTSIVRSYVVTARTAGSSFTVTASAAPVTNPACMGYKIEN